MPTQMPSANYRKRKRRAISKSRVYTALSKLGDGWHGTREIARAIGRDHLYGSDRGVLAQLVASGILEWRELRVDNAPHLNRYEYRLVGTLPSVDLPDAESRFSDENAPAE